MGGRDGSLRRTPFQVFHSTSSQQLDPASSSGSSSSSNQPTLATNGNGKSGDKDGDKDDDKDGEEDGEEEEDVPTKDPEFNEPSWNPSNEEEMEITPTEDLPFTFIDDITNTSTISTIVANPDLYSHQVFPRSKEDIAKQQALFDTFIRQFDHLCDLTEQEGKVVIMKPHRLSGLGNNIRTIMTGMYLAVVTNRGMRCRSLN